jgi:haloalkane dehalogenase
MSLRTPDERFAGLPGFPWQAKYADDLPGYEGLRAAFVDEGPREAQVFLCLHGEPTWSYLYRKMIPVFLAAGGRVVAPDFFGFGRSDKPADDGAYSFHFHRDFLLRLIERLDLHRITLVVQDWGGLLGLTLPPALPQRFARLIAMNTGLATGRSPGPGFDAWRAYMAKTPDLDVGRLMKRTVPALTDAEAKAYDAPFPDASYKAGVRAFPNLVMTEPQMPGVGESKAALAFWSKEWTGQAFIAHGAADPIFRAEHMEALRKLVRGAPPVFTVPEAGHFVQEWGAQVAEAALHSFG